MGNQLFTTAFVGLLVSYVGASSNSDDKGIPGIRIPTVEETKVVPIVTVIPGKLVIDSFAIDSILDKIGDRPFGLYSINGPSRSGKSYLISQFVNYLNGSYNLDNLNLTNGFEWRGDTDRCTRGINMWSDPFEVTLGDGSTLPILLVDTQGCFDEKSPLELDAKLFAIATLLSSVQIFNTIRTLDEATLQFLEAFTGVASMSNTIALPVTEHVDSDPDFQKLIVLIRDFQFRDYDFGYYDNTHQPRLGGKNFKVDKLNPQDTQPEDHQRTRFNIVQSFQETAIYLMPHPGNQLAMHDNPNKLDPDFKKYQDDLIHLLFHPKNLVTKMVDRSVVTATEFKLYVSKWTEVLEKIQNLKLPKTSEGAAEIQYLTGIESAKTEYLSEMDKLLTNQKFRVDSYEVEKRHNQVISSLCKSFDSKLFFRKRSENTKRFKRELESWSRGMLSKYYQLNSDKYEYWMYCAILTWKMMYPYLIYLMATLIIFKIVRFLTGF